MLSPRRAAATAIFGIPATAPIVLVAAGSLTPGAALTTAAFAAAPALIALGVRRLDGGVQRPGLPAVHRDGRPGTQHLCFAMRFRRYAHGPPGVR